MSDATEPVQRRAPRWMKWALGLSLALNLAIAGLAVGALLRSSEHIHGVGMMRSLHQVSRDMPDASRENIRSEIRSLRRDVREKMQQTRDLRAGIADAVAQDPYDAETVAAALDRMGAHREEVRRLIDARFAELVATLPAAERVQLADHLRSRGRKQR